MSLRERIQRSKTTHTQRQKVLFEKYGLLENPFPAAGQPFGHPHLATDIDENIENGIDEFENGSQKTLLNRNRVLTQLYVKYFKN
jgi:hypothetical protein